MKLKYQFVVRDVSGKPVAVAVGQDNEKFNGMIKLNRSGEFVFRLLMEGDHSLEEILCRVVSQFDVTEEKAKPTVLAFLDQLQKNGLLEQ